MTAANGAVYAVQGPILDKYSALDDKARKDLGTDGQPTDESGRRHLPAVRRRRDHLTQANAVWGKIRDKWNRLGGSHGKLGYPTSDEVGTPGIKKSTLEHGTITWKPGRSQKQPRGPLGVRRLIGGLIRADYTVPH